MFYMSFIEPYKNMDIVERRQISLLSLEVYNNQKFDIKEFLNSRQYQNRIEYFIYWCKYDIYKSI